MCVCVWCVWCVFVLLHSTIAVILEFIHTFI